MSKAQVNFDSLGGGGTTEFISCTWYANSAASILGICTPDNTYIWGYDITRTAATDNISITGKSTTNSMTLTALKNCTVQVDKYTMTNESTTGTSLVSSNTYTLSANDTQTLSFTAANAYEAYRITVL